MIVRIPYLFPSVAVERHHSRPTNPLRGGWHPVEIETTSAAEAPVAMSCASVTERAGTVRYTTRWHGGRHWVSTSVLDRIAPATLRAGHLAAKGPDGLPGPVMARLVHPSLGYSREWTKAFDLFLDGKLPPFDPASFRELLWQDEDAGMEDAERTGREFLVIGGDLHAAVREPRYTVRPVHQARAPVRAAVRVHLFPDVHVLRDEERPSRSCVFRADREEDMHEYIRDAFPPGTQVNVDGSIEVLHPGSVNFDDETHTLLSQARRIVGADEARAPWDSNEGFEMLRDMDWVHASRWFGLRDELDSQDPSTESIAAMMGTLAEAMPAGNMRETTESVMRRWELRPVQGSPRPG